MTQHKTEFRDTAVIKRKKACLPREGSYWFLTHVALLRTLTCFSRNTTGENAEFTLVSTCKVFCFLRQWKAEDQEIVQRHLNINFAFFLWITSWLYWCIFFFFKFFPNRYIIPCVSCTGQDSSWISNNVPP